MKSSAFANFARLYDQGAARYRSYPPRQRLVLAAGGLLVLVTLLGSLVESTYASARQAHQRLATKRAELAVLKADVELLASLKALPVKALPAGGLKDSIARSATDAGLTELAASLQADGASRLRATGKVPFDRFAAWQANVQAMTALRVDRLQITPVPEGGMVKVEITLTHPDG